MKFRKLKGTYDVTPKDSDYFQYIENTIREVVEGYGYKKIVFPVIEYVDLFARGVGEGSDIVVKKEMYVFEDRGKRLIALRPEGTASAVRLYLENNLGTQGYASRMYYIGPMFRAENPQAGRYRQFFQFGVEYIGDPSPYADVEIIKLNWDILNALGVKGFVIYINSIGDVEDRARYMDSLKEYFADKLDDMCEDCRARYETNPLRMLDCKNEQCRVHIEKAPVMLDFLSGEGKEHFEKVKMGLDDLGVKYEIDPQIVRGLDYYNRTVFEIKHLGLGAQSTFSAGGRYDGLVREFGGMDTPAAGFAIGLERLGMVVKEAGNSGEDVFSQPYQVYIACIGEENRGETNKILFRLRQAGIRAVTEHRFSKLKKHMKAADSMNALNVLFVGEDEIKNNKFVLRNMKDGNQTEGSLEEIIKIIK